MSPWQLWDASFVAMHAESTGCYSNECTQLKCISYGHYVGYIPPSGEISINMTEVKSLSIWDGCTV